MNFTANDEQRMIADSFARVFADAGYPSTSADNWSALTELGLTEATFPEPRGFGAGVSDMVHTLIECGRAAAPEPVIGAGILPGIALSRAGSAAPEMPEGTVCLADDKDLELKDSTLSGTLRVVPGADAAEVLLICLADDRLAVVPMAEVKREPYRLVDGRGAADIELASVNLADGAIGGVVPGMAAWLRDVAAVTFAADALGALLALREMTQDYLKQRKQFGRPISSFQALQHAMADIYHDTEHFLSLTHFAAQTCEGTDVALRMRAVSSLKLFLGGRIRSAAASAIQLHGGIGMTEEYPLGRFVKRALVADMLNGSADAHGARLAKLIAEETRAGLQEAPEQEKVA